MSSSYVLKTIFPTQPSEEDILGAISLICYTIFIMVTIKYIIFVLRADNRGEGGVFALLGLLLGEEGRETIDIEDPRDKAQSCKPLLST